MKRFHYLVLAAVLALLTACGGGMSARDYLTENVAYWNGTTSTVQQWTVGPQSEQLQRALQEGKGLGTFKFALGNAQKEQQDRLVSIDQMPPSDDAKDLHQKLRTYVQTAEELFGVLLQIAELPDGYSQEQIAPLAEKLTVIGERMDVEMQALSDAQDAYAKQHRINLQKH
ncbi:hypothetical protein ACLB90_15945 [Stenotrophomonas sp. LGBM10]|uniref:hypothetical protein n=1 Tax=Stenotrophomonas sp. LGBM10 TaxID=3390038 RepID=UPI00398AA42A